MTANHTSRVSTTAQARPVDRVEAALITHGCTGRNSMWTCPAHDDQNPSLSLSEGADGRALLWCHAGCSSDAVLAALGLTTADLYERTNGHGHSMDIVATYDYTDEAGELLYEVVRLVPKSFRQRRPDGAGGWSWRLGDTRRVLYRLPQVVAAVAAGDTVFVVEGERDADRLAAAGFTATCNPGGAGKWRGEYDPVLSGAHVVVVADRDPAGYRHALDVHRHLHGVAADIRTVEPAVGKDVTDHLAAGHTVDQLEVVTVTELEQLVAETPHDQPGSHTTNPGRQLVLTAASDIAVQRVRWLWEGRIATGTLALLAGPEGVGKSTLAYERAARVTRGELEGEHHGTPKGVLVCATEDSWAHTIVPRLMAHDADLDRVWRVEIQLEDEIRVGLTLPSDLDEVVDAAQQVDAALLILDPLMSRLHTELDSHRDGEVRRALEPLVSVADTTGMAVIGLIHHNKSGSSDPLQLVMASKAFTAVARSVHTTIRDPEDETGRRVLFGTPKNNLGRTDLPTLTFTIESWTYPVPGDPVAGVTGRLTWGPDSHTSIVDALAATAAGPEARTATNDAAAWLTDWMSLDGHQVIPSVEVKAAGKAAGHSQDALKRARRNAGIGSTPAGFPRRTYWSRAGMTPDDVDAWLAAHPDE